MNGFAPLPEILLPRRILGSPSGVEDAAHLLIRVRPDTTRVPDSSPAVRHSQSFARSCAPFCCSGLPSRNIAGDDSRPCHGGAVVTST
jgi:hypothetical protein